MFLTNVEGYFNKQFSARMYKKLALTKLYF